MSIHPTSLLVQQNDNDYSIEDKKFTNVDELCRLDQGLELAQSTTHNFKNFSEELKSMEVIIKNNNNLEKLTA